MYLLNIIRMAGYKADVSLKSHQLRGIAHLLGEMDLWHPVRDEGMVRILSNASVRKGQAYTTKQFYQMCQPCNEFYQHLSALVEKRFFMRGYNLVCPHCAMNLWYRVSDVSGVTTCQGCYRTFPLYLDAEFAYQPNPLVIEGLKNGALTILLTLFWLHQNHEQVVEWETNVDINKSGQQTDIDLFVNVDGKLMLWECKDNFKTDNASRAKRIAQLKQQQTIAESLHAEFGFASLAEEDSIEKILKTVSEPIKLLKRDDLLML